jgi:hypothetical protein
MEVGEAVDLERSVEFEALPQGGEDERSSRLLVAATAPQEGVTCKQAFVAAKRQCLEIKTWRGVAQYVYEHRQMAFFMAVSVGLVALLCSGLLFYYEPLQLAYKNIDTPVLHGYDLVAYFSLGTWAHAARGRPSLALERFYNWTDPRDNTTYSYSFWFSSEANRQRFARDPWRYIPRYGGFSAYKTATESFWHPYPDPQTRGAAPFAHPDAFVIKDAQLYMEYSLEYKKLFMQSQDVIRLADIKWTAWYGGLRAGPLNNFAVRGRFLYAEERRQWIVPSKKL